MTSSLMPSYSKLCRHWAIRNNLWRDTWGMHPWQREYSLWVSNAERAAGSWLRCWVWSSPVHCSVVLDMRYCSHCPASHLLLLQWLLSVTAFLIPSQHHQRSSGRKQGQLSVKCLLYYNIQCLELLYNDEKKWIEKISQLNRLISNMDIKMKLCRHF